MKKIQAVIFDMDGLLVDSEPIQFKTSQLLFLEYGHLFTFRHLKRFLGVRLVEELEILKKEWKLGDSVDKLLEKRKGIFLGLIRQKLRLAKGAKELLNFLQRNKIPIGLGTSAELWYIREVMKKFRLQRFFKIIVGAEQIRNGKPHPEVYLTVAKRLEIPPKNCLVLEDAINGVVAAKRAGMICFAIPNPFTPKKNYQKADQVFSSLQEVKHKLKNQLLEI